MSIILPDTQEANILNWFLKSETLTLKLFSNDVIPDEASVIADFTEVSGGGYVAIPILVGEWVLETGDPTILNAGVKTFTFTGAPSPATVYGYYLIDPSNNLKFAERFSSTITPFVPSAGSQVKLSAIVAAS